MAVAEKTARTNDLDALWRSIPRRLAEGNGWALSDILAAGVAGYTRDHDTPEGLLIRHNPVGTRDLVRINIKGPDTVVRSLG
jgi:hypothetical protein